MLQQQVHLMLVLKLGNSQENSIVKKYLFIVLLVGACCGQDGLFSVFKSKYPKVYCEKCDLSLTETINGFICNDGHMRIDKSAFRKDKNGNYVYDADKNNGDNLKINIDKSESGGSINLKELLKNASIMIGFNQSFYGEDFDDYTEDIEDNGLDLSKTPYRKINFTMIHEYEHGFLGGVKYLSYGYDIDYDGVDNEGSMIEQSLRVDLKFLKLFLTYPMGSGLYFGLEGGYFMEGEIKYNFRGTKLSGQVYSNNINQTLDRDYWEDIDYSGYDYGLLGQYYYLIKDNILFTSELFYSLSKFSEDNSIVWTAIPNSFNYFNFGLTYKFKK